MLLYYFLSECHIVLDQLFVVSTLVPDMDGNEALKCLLQTSDKSDFPLAD